MFNPGGWGGAGSSSFLPTGSTDWENGPLGSALEVETNTNTVSLLYFVKHDLHQVLNK